MAFLRIDYSSDIFADFRTHIIALEGETPQLLGKFLNLVGESVKTQLEEATPQDEDAPDPEGPLRNSYIVESSDMQTTVSTTQGTKLRYVRFGTGIYGIFDHPIVPIHAQFLKFTIGSEVFFRRSVRGQEANDFVLPILDDVMNTLDGLLPELYREIDVLLGG